jgi:diguanylate cyclase (GGDEF)-like protein/PAS domain S-box-containing protein
MEGNQQVTARILLAEDVAADAELSMREFKRAGMRVDWRVVDSPEAFSAALFEFDPEVILSDFSMCGFDGLAALQIARDLAPDTPFVFVSGTLGEEHAIRALKNGATDYVLKTNLIRLPAAVTRALRDAAERAARREMQVRFDTLHERMHALFETLPDAVWSIALPETKLIYMSPAARVVLGHSPEEFAANVELRRRIVHPADLGRVEQAWAALRAGKRYEIEYRIVLPDESVRWIQERAQRVCGADGAPVRLDGIARDVTERVGQRERLERLARIRELLGTTNAAIVRLRDRGELFAEFCRIAVDVGGFLGGRVLDFDAASGSLRVAVATDGWGALGEIVEAYNRDPQGSQSLLAEALRSGQPVVSNDLVADLKDKRREWRLPGAVRSLGYFPLFIGKRVEGALVVVAAERDVFDEAEVKLLSELAANLSLALERGQQQQRIDYLAYYDILTGLPNRRLFYERLDQALAGRDTARVALVTFDVERFKTINETFSLAAGDRVLQHFTQRLVTFARDRFVLGRLGANEFALLMPRVGDSGEVGRMLTLEASALLDSIIEFEGRELRIAVRAGVAMCPDDGTDADTLLRNAQAALRKAKAGSERYVFYAPSLNARVAERLELESKLRRAVERFEFALHYQPKVRLTDRRVTGFEALLRWPGAAPEMASPAQFVPVLEETGLIDRLGPWLMREAVKTYRGWRARGFVAPRIAVNVSASQLRSREYLMQVCDAVGGSAEDCGLDLEITESVLMESIDDSGDKLRQVRELGVRIALDDFGTGYSSLGYLSRLPIDTLKIDRTFISQMTEKADDASIVSAMISLGKALNLTIVAEGVETEEQARLLRLLRCHEMQGFLFSRPVPKEQLEYLLAPELV